MHERNFNWLLYGINKVIRNTSPVKFNVILVRMKRKKNENDPHVTGNNEIMDRQREVTL